MADKTVDTNLTVNGVLDADSVTQGGVAVVIASTLSSGGKGYIDHGAEASTARISGFASIEWHGSVEPTNAVNGDTWVDTS